MKTLDNFELIIQESIKIKVWNDSWMFVHTKAILYIVDRINSKIFRLNKRNIDFVINPIRENFRQF